MEVMVERCCGLDVHQETVVACLLVTEPGRRTRKEIREFRTFTVDLEALRDWLVANRCLQVAMESTGVYWMPVYAVLEGSVEIVVGNAAHLKNVPGRKTDVKDAEWIAQLVRAGLIRKSYVPTKEIRALRKFVRYRRSLVAGRTDERNRLQKLLESANIKLGAVASDVFGKSGWLMLKALVEGTKPAEDVANLALGLLRKKIEPLTKALQGRLDDDDRWLLRAQMDRLERVDADIAAIEAKIDEHLTPHAELRERLMHIPGVSLIVAAVLIAEIGANVDAFPTDHHLAKWAGLCPGNNESAGKRFNGTTMKGNEHLRTALVEAAQAAVRKKGSYYKAKFHRLKARRGYKRAIFAIAHKILRAVWYVMKTGREFKDLGETYLDYRDQKRLTRRHVERLEALGYTVTLTVSSPAPTPAA
jgi:transposase